MGAVNWALFALNIVLVVALVIEVTRARRAWAALEDEPGTPPGVPLAKPWPDKVLITHEQPAESPEHSHAA